jgi:hypothetical protein
LVEERPCVLKRNDARINTTSSSIVANGTLIANQFVPLGPPPALTIEVKLILRLQTLNVEAIVTSRPRASLTGDNEIMKKKLVLKNV